MGVKYFTKLVTITWNMNYWHIGILYHLYQYALLFAKIKSVSFCWCLNRLWLLSHIQLLMPTASYSHLLLWCNHPPSSRLLCNGWLCKPAKKLGQYGDKYYIQVKQYEINNNMQSVRQPYVSVLQVAECNSTCILHLKFKFVLCNSDEGIIANLFINICQYHS